MSMHDLKTWPEPFEAVWRDLKRAEFRRDDRGFAVGDFLVLREWDPGTGRYTGRVAEVRVTHIVRGPSPFGIPEGCVMMSIILLSRQEDAPDPEPRP